METTLLYSLGGLFVSAFTSATILPGTSEAVLAALLYAHPDSWLWAWLLAGWGNTLGSLVTYGMGRVLPQRLNKIPPRAQTLLHRYGAWTLLLAWVPILGDALPLAAGCLRLPVWWCGAALAVGKFARYAVVVAGMLALA